MTLCDVNEPRGRSVDVFDHSATQLVTAPRPVVIVEEVLRCEDVGGSFQDPQRLDVPSSVQLKVTEPGQQDDVLTKASAVKVNVPSSPTDSGWPWQDSRSDHRWPTTESFR